MKARFVNPYTDFGFKKLFGEEESLKVYRDLKGVVDTSFEEGIEEGIQIGEGIGFKKGKTQMARAMKQEGLAVELIAKLSGLTPDDIEKL